MKYLVTKIATASLFALITLSAKANPIKASSLNIECSGQLTIVGYENVGVMMGFLDRGNHFHPAQSYGTLILKVTEATAGCQEIKTKLDIDILTATYEAYFSTKQTNLADVEILLKNKIGQNVEFTTQQQYTYQDAQGNLPFYPFLHGESISIKTPNLNVISRNSLIVDVKKTYPISLVEVQLVQLTESIFAYIQSHGSSDPLSQKLIPALFQNHPHFENNFKNFLNQVLKIFDQVEQNNNSDFNFGLLKLAEGIKSLTHKYPQYYSFNLVSLVGSHPSLLKGDSLPNISAQDLEMVVTEVEKQLAEGSMNPNIKESFKEPLKYLAGVYAPSGPLGVLASTYTEQKAKMILKTYY